MIDLQYIPSFSYNWLSAFFNSSSQSPLNHVSYISITYLHHFMFLIFFLSSYLYARHSSIQPSAAHITWHTTHWSLHTVTSSHTNHVFCCYHHHISHLSLCPLPTTRYLTMNVFPNGTRVYYWDGWINQQDGRWDVSYPRQGGWRFDRQPTCIKCVKGHLDVALDAVTWLGTVKFPVVRRWWTLCSYTCRKGQLALQFSWQLLQYLQFCINMFTHLFLLL